MDYGKVGEVAASNRDTAAEEAAKLVPDRIVQIDADFFCYHAVVLEEDIAANFKGLLRILRYNKRRCRAERANAHITMGIKSGREFLYEQYQEHRSGNNEEVKDRVRILRDMLANHTCEDFDVIASTYLEADDAMCIAQNKELENSCILSGDKDLWMVQGLHIDTKDFSEWYADGYGETVYKEVGNVKPKLIGKGTSWFWHQMIMGDSADNIKGLEKIAVVDANKYFPTVKFNPKRTPLACGEAKAVEVLHGVTSDAAAAARVLDLYQNWYGSTGIEEFVKNGYLLWMQREDSTGDVLKFFKECGYNFSFTNVQVAKLNKYLEKRDEILHSNQ